MELPDGTNPFDGFMEKLEAKRGKKKLNPVQELANLYYEMNGWDKMPKSFYVGKMGYSKVCLEAKELLQILDNNFDDCVWALDRMKYLAEKGGFEWRIRTCMTHKKI